MTQEGEPPGRNFGEKPTPEPDREPQTAEEWADYFTDPIIEKRQTLSEQGYDEIHPPLQGKGPEETSLKYALMVEKNLADSEKHDDNKELLDARAALEAAVDALKQAHLEGACRGSQFNTPFYKIRGHVRNLIDSSEVDINEIITLIHQKILLFILQSRS